MHDHYSAIPPVLFGLVVECDHVFGSRWLIDKLNRLGLCFSYSEVNRFKQSVVSPQNIYDPEVNKHPETFTQFVADNVDHNLATHDGSGSFHNSSIDIQVTGHSCETEMYQATLYGKVQIGLTQ